MPSSWVVSLLAGAVGLAFGGTVALHWARSRRPFQLAWAAGLVAYGVAGLAEAAGIALGWSEPLYRVYFPMAAATVGLLGLGTILLVAPRAVARASAVAVVLLVLVAGVAPLTVPLPAEIPSDVGAKAVPFPNAGRIAFLVLNVAGGLALIGGALWSWWRTRRAGVILIGVGAMLPFAGGSLSTLFAFDVRALLQLVGILVMFAGYLQGRETRAADPGARGAEA